MADAPAESATPRIETISFGPRFFERRTHADLPSALEHAAKPGRSTWLDVEGVPIDAAVGAIERAVDLHPVAAEILRDGSARAVVEDFGGHLIAEMLMPHEHGAAEVVNFIVTRSLVVTLQERPGDCFGVVRERLRTSSEGDRAIGAEFVFALLAREVCLAYQPILEKIDARILKLEDSLATKPDRGMLERIHLLRAKLMYVRQQVVPLREAISTLLAHRVREDLEKQLALRLVYDDLCALQDELDFHRDGVHRLTDLYMNGMSNRLNDVMRVLTVISTIFMPLSFIASIYGMNFARETSPWNMPELGWRLGYPFALALMAIVAGSFVIFFSRKGWLRDPGAPRRHGIDGLAADVAEFIGVRKAVTGRAKRARRSKLGAVRTGRTGGSGEDARPASA